MTSPRAYPGLYMAIDPRPSQARAAVERMLDLAGTADERTLAMDGLGCAVAAIALPGNHPGTGPAVHADRRGLLVWTGEMHLPPSWLDHSSHEPSPENVAAIVRQKLLLEGPEILGEIDGSFCGACFNTEDQTWTVFNDRWGLIPLFWWAQGPRLIVSPKAQLPWRVSRSALQVNPEGVADLLRTQNMLDDHTLIDGVHWLEPASCLEWQDTRTAVRPYWDYHHRPQHVARYEEVLDSFVEASRATIHRMTATPGPIMQGLSGGLDSRIFLAVCQDLGHVPQCYTSGFAYGEDMRFGRKLARVAGVPHDALLMNERSLPDQLRQAIFETEGLHGAAHLVLSSPIPSYLAGHEGAVLIEGYLHGVLGGSDLPAEADVPADRPPHQHTWAVDFLHSGGEPGLIDSLLHPTLAEESSLRWQDHVDASFARARSDDPLCRAEYAIITGRSGRNDVLVPAMFRRHVLAHHPACNRRMIDWYAATPARLRRARQVYIDVLRTRYPRLARVPRADGCSGMPLGAGRWSREYHWQMERVYSHYARLRYPHVRRWGRHSIASRAWAMETCRTAGMFESLLAPDARVLEWVRPQAVQGLWAAACTDPQRSVPLLSLLTIELMIRELERAAVPATANARIAFKTFSPGAVRARECVGVA